jgi:hypothetical protein
MRIVGFQLNTANFKSIILSGLFLLCLIGTQFSGIVHEISHDSFLKGSLTSESKVNSDSTFGHDSLTKSCKLFDGLALSSLLVVFLFTLSLIPQSSEEYKESKLFFFRLSVNSPYSSRAPPKY